MFRSNKLDLGPPVVPIFRREASPPKYQIDFFGAPTWCEKDRDKDPRSEMGQVYRHDPVRLETRKANSFNAREARIPESCMQAVIWDNESGKLIAVYYYGIMVSRPEGHPSEKVIDQQERLGREPICLQRDNDIYVIGAQSAIAPKMVAILDPRVYPYAPIYIFNRGHHSNNAQATENTVQFRFL